MPLTQNDRIKISRKLVKIPIENAQADNLINELNKQLTDAQNLDLANKNLMDKNTPLINAYQAEIELYDGNQRTQLTEQDLIDSANKKIKNPFFPNDPNTTMPSIPDGVWKFFTPFAGNKAIGKNYDETYNAITGELNIINNMLNLIATIESISDPIRSTGLACSTDPITGNAVYNPDPTMQNAGTNLISEVTNWKNQLNTIYPIIPTSAVDPDPTRQLAADAARSDITNRLNDIATWETYPDYDTTTSLPPDCATYNSMTYSNFVASKFRQPELTALKNSILARQSYLNSVRIAEINSYLGNINQDLSNGNILGGSGWYYERFLFINARLHLMTGSLNQVVSFQSGINAQNELKTANNTLLTAYNNVMVATACIAPAIGNEYLFVKDPTGFSINDDVFVIADNQAEIAAKILDISGNRFKFDVTIPKKYRETDLLRVYKDLT